MLELASVQRLARRLLPLAHALLLLPRRSVDAAPRLDLARALFRFAAAPLVLPHTLVCCSHLAPHPLARLLEQSFRARRPSRVRSRAASVGPAAASSPTAASGCSVAAFARDAFISRRRRCFASVLRWWVLPFLWLRASTVSMAPAAARCDAAVGSAKAGSAEVGSAEVGSAEVGSAEVGSAEAGSAEAATAEVVREALKAAAGSVEAGSAEAGSAAAARVAAARGAARVEEAMEVAVRAVG